MLRYFRSTMLLAFILSVCSCATPRPDPNSTTSFLNFALTHLENDLGHSSSHVRLVLVSSISQYDRNSARSLRSVVDMEQAAKTGRDVYIVQEIRVSELSGLIRGEYFSGRVGRDGRCPSTVRISATRGVEGSGWTLGESQVSVC